MRRLLSHDLVADSNCIDVGCHEGRFLADIVRWAPDGNHIAYEPLPHLAKKLKINFPDVDVRAAALSNADGEATFHHVKNLPAYNGLRRRAYPLAPSIELITVRIERLDDHLPVDYVPRLIKIDVEGAEHLVLQGAVGTITRHRPIVLFEHGRGASDYYDCSPADVFEILSKTAGLRIFDLGGTGPYSLPQLEDAYARNTHWNFAARP